MMRALKLDVGNPNPGNIGSDFERLGLLLWPAAAAVDARSSARRVKLETMNMWRNAIAHQDLAAPRLQGRRSVTLRLVTSWRSACNGLAGTFERVAADHLRDVVGATPW